MHNISCILLFAASTAFGQTDQPALPTDGMSFVVLGHLRGDPTENALKNGLLEELVGDCARLRPDLVFLTGDAIWGDYHGAPTDRGGVVEEWETLDRELAKIGAPVHRVPGNHDINDIVTRDVWNERYGPLPQAVRRGRSLFLLLSTAWIPRDGEGGKARGVRGVPIDEAQLEFIDTELARDEHDHAFVFVHHVRWWHEESEWWRDVHPRLRDRKVRAVFAGDYGPTKYSRVGRDGIDYVQVAIETEQDLEHLRVNDAIRVLSSQLDVYAQVVVEGDAVRIDVRTIGATSTDRYSPARYRAVNELSPRDYVWYNTWATTRRRRLVACGLLALGFALGVVVTWIAGRLWRRLLSAKRST